MSFIKSISNDIEKAERKIDEVNFLIRRLNALGVVVSENKSGLRASCGGETCFIGDGIKSFAVKAKVFLNGVFWATISKK